METLEQGRRATTNAMLSGAASASGDGNAMSIVESISRDANTQKSGAGP